MRAYRVGLPMMFLLMLGIASLFMPTDGYTVCTNPCMCGYGCYSGCQCPGTNGCKWCAMPTIENLQVNVPPLPEAIPDRSAYDSTGASIAINSYSIDRMIRRVASGQCAQNKFRLKMTDEASVLKLEEAFLKDYSATEELIVSKTSPSEER